MLMLPSIISQLNKKRKNNVSYQTSDYIRYYYRHYSYWCNHYFNYYATNSELNQIYLFLKVIENTEAEETLG